MEAIGWAGSAFFAARFLVQWVLSERAGRSVTPPSFWWLSLVGCVCMSTYVAWRGDPFLLAGYLLNGAVYVRNLFLLERREHAERMKPALLALLAILGLGALVTLVGARMREGLGSAPLWIAVVVVGEFAHTARFFVQWLHSERRGISHFPRSFWYLGLVGNLMLLAYAIHLSDAVLIANFVPAPLIQVRNLMLASDAAEAEDSPTAPE